MLDALRDDGLFSAGAAVLCGVLLAGILLTRPSTRNLTAEILGAVRARPGLLQALLLSGAGALMVLFACRKHILPIFPLAGLPAFHEAFLRASESLLGAAAVLGAALVPGGLICRAFGFSDEPAYARTAFAMVFGLAALSLGSSALALGGVYSETVVRSLILLLFLGWCIVEGPRLLDQAAEYVRMAAAGGGFGNTLRAPRGGVWIAAAAPAVAAAFLAALAPEIEYDALWYHLRLARDALEAGRPLDIIHEHVSLYPLNWEMLFGAGLALGGPGAAKLLHFACLPLGALLIIRTVRRFLPGASAGVAASVFLTAPTVIWEASTAYVDLALALYVLAGVYGMLRYLESRRWMHLAAAGLAFGFALGIKHLGLLVLAAVAPLLAAELWTRERDVRKALAPAALLAAGALLLATPWYLRSFLASGNPVFPYAYSLFGAQPAMRWDGFGQEMLSIKGGEFGMGRDPAALLLLPWNLTLHAWEFGGALGPLLLLLLGALFLVRIPARPLRLVGLLSLLYLGLWAAPIGSQNMRFLLPVIPLLAVLASAGWQRLSRAVHQAGWMRGLRLLSLGAGGMMLLQLPPFTSLHERDRVEWEGWLSHCLRKLPAGVVAGAERGEDYLSRIIPSWQALQFINAELPSDARILSFAEGEDFYLRRERLHYYEPIARPAVLGARAGRESESRAHLRNLGITHVLFVKDHFEEGWVQTLAMGGEIAFQTWYEILYEDDNCLLCRVKNTGGLPDDTP
ncbi:MAG: glycosyltransferase family 39 protein [Bacteroidota bacterium]